MTDQVPEFRKLKGYAFDPSLSLKRETAAVNNIVYQVRWEDLAETKREKEKTGQDHEYIPQGPGPVGEYIEVIDFDPTVDKLYKPVDLNSSYILAEGGLNPSSSNPQFHQQMVYAVAMTTIQNFESALGRKILWAPRRLAEGSGEYETYVHRLRIYPHALREANAFYSPQKKALLFGYFSSSPADETLHMPESLVFTCLSHDIIAHEITHAILDGMHRYYNEPSNPDVLAFHEAFADIVALFQHFTFPEVLRQQIAKTRGDLKSQNLLGQLAQEFGTAIGSYGSLRDALGQYNDQGIWEPAAPDPEDYRKVMEPHQRGSILVAAVFEAFISIYDSRTADLLRIASNGTGILPEGALHPDLVNRLAEEASKAAGHVLRICIRALDYCPPVDINFGDYLRAIITADRDLVSVDKYNYRLAFIEAFRRRGIYPHGIKTLSVESLQHSREPNGSKKLDRLFKIISAFLRDYREEVMYEQDRKKLFIISREFIAGKYVKGRRNIQGLHERIYQKFRGSEEFTRLTGMVFLPSWNGLGIRDSGSGYGPSFEIQNLRLVSINRPDGGQINQIVFSLVQRCGVEMKNKQFHGHYMPSSDEEEQAPSIERFELRGGCTMIFDLDTLKLKYGITKPLVDLETLKPGESEIDQKRIKSQYQYQFSDLVALKTNEFSKHFGLEIKNPYNEPFALLHFSHHT